MPQETIPLSYKVLHIYPSQFRASFYQETQEQISGRFAVTYLKEQTFGFAH